jgi:aspartate/methionine/tyrosine aminotransferase
MRVFPRYLGEEGVEAFCRDLLDEAVVVLLPASIFGSPLAAVPGDRFRIGLGRGDPEQPLAAFNGLLRGR